MNHNTYLCSPVQCMLHTVHTCNVHRYVCTYAHVPAHLTPHTQSCPLSLLGSYGYPYIHPPVHIPTHSHTTHAPCADAQEHTKHEQMGAYITSSQCSWLPSPLRSWLPSPLRSWLPSPLRSHTNSVRQH